MRDYCVQNRSVDEMCNEKKGNSNNNKSDLLAEMSCVSFHMYLLCVRVRNLA